MTTRKILLLSVSAGAGHARAAEAIRAAAQLHQPGIDGAPLEVLHLDVMTLVTPAFRKVYTDFYIKLVNKYPALWGYLYQATNDAPPDSSVQKLRRRIERLNTKPLLKAIAGFQPDQIICTHFLPAEILAHTLGKGRLDCPVWVQVTDFDVHRLWVQEGMAGYFAASDEVAFRMRALGVRAHAIHVTGIPVMPAFGQELDRQVCAAEFGLDPLRKTVLLMGGGAGLGDLGAIAKRLLTLDAGSQLIVTAGKNAGLLASLQSLAALHPGRLLAQGFTDKVERLMACADLIVTKPGGLTSAECLAMGLPMIVNSPIPGQEEHNAVFLLEQGVALKAFDLVTLEYRIGLLLSHPGKLAAMRARALAIGRPDAARRVLEIVLGTTPGDTRS